MTHPQLEGEVDADFLIAGAGYTGLWTAWHLLAAEPGAKLVLVDSEQPGHGPSGRNGGFVESLAPAATLLSEAMGPAGATELIKLSQRSVEQIEQFCSEQEVDAWFRRGGFMQVSTAPAQDRLIEQKLVSCRELVGDFTPAALSQAQVRARCDSPRFRAGLLHAGLATVQPARLALGLADRVAAAGCRIFSESPVLRLSPDGGGYRAETPRGRVKAGKAILALGGAFAAARSPFRNGLTVASSHVVITEPVPELLERIGWTGGECIVDSRALVHYFRTTPDGRIAFGWGGGRIACGGRTHGRAEVDPTVVKQVIRTLLDYFPGLAGRRIEHAWGGPIDASPSHLPVITQLGDGALAAFGYTGNGVGPSQLVGRSLAGLALGHSDEYTRHGLIEPAASLRRLPPEPLRWAGGNLIRAAIDHNEQIETAGGKPGPVSRAVGEIPALIGFHIGR